MITGLEILGFRALRYMRLPLDRFHILVGPNASGKSTFFDAINLVRDILNAGLERAIRGDQRFDIPLRAVDPKDLTWNRGGDPVEIVLTVEIPPEIQSTLEPQYSHARYEISISVKGELRISNENFWLCRGNQFAQNGTADWKLFPAPPPSPATIVSPAGRRTPIGWRKVIGKTVETSSDYFKSETTDWNSTFRLGPSRSSLANLPEDAVRFPVATWFKRFLTDGIQRLTLNAERIRVPSPPGMVKAFLADGSNLPWVIQDLSLRAPDRFDGWIDHVKTALPDLRTIKTVERPEDKSRYLVIEYESGLEAPSWVVSDGTLRILALTLLAYAVDAPQLLLVEEPENGIHPQAIQTVFDALANSYESQVFCASHSPIVLSLAEKSQVLCFNKSFDGAVDVVRGDNHPRLLQWEGALNLGEVFAAGILS